VTLLTVTGLEHGFGTGRARLEVLKGLNLTMQAGELVALMGPSGCGKSTLLNIIGGLLEAEYGNLVLGLPDGPFEYGQTHPKHLAELRRHGVGWIFQDFHLFEHMSARDNVLFALELAGVYGATAEARADEALARLGLADRAGNRPGELSGGQAQRVAVARAIAGHRRLLLADEPTGNLDLKTGNSIITAFKELTRHPTDPLSVLMVTHDPDVAVQADRMWLLREGRLVQATVEESGGTATRRGRAAAAAEAAETTEAAEAAA